MFKQTRRPDVSALLFALAQRLGLFMMVGVPKVFSTFWSAIEKFVDPKTYRKIRVIPYDMKKGEKKVWEKVCEVLEKCETTPQRRVAFLV